MKWTLSNYSHKSNFLFYDRESLPRLNFEFCSKRVFSDLETSLDASWHVLYNQFTFVWELTVGFGAASFIFNHLAYGEWWISWMDNELVASTHE